MTRRLRTLALGTGLFGLIPVAAFAQGAGGYDWSGFYAGATLGVVHRGDSDTATYPDTASNGTDYRFSGGNLYLGGTEMWVVEVDGRPNCAHFRARADAMSKLGIGVALDNFRGQAKR